MNSFMITLNPCSKSQQQIHDFYKLHSVVTVTQRELCKSGQQHYHIYITTFLTLSEVQDHTSNINPPLSQYTNVVKQANTFGGSMKYLFKDVKHNTPLLHGVTLDECRKAINKYKNNSRTNLRRQQADSLIRDRISSSIDLQSKLTRLHKEQRAIVDIALQKSVGLLQLFRDIEDMDSLQEEYVRFQELLDKRHKLLTSDEIFNCYKEFVDQYIPTQLIYNGIHP